MSNTAQTISVIASLVIVFGAQTAWILRAFVQVDRRLDRIDHRLDGIDGRMTGVEVKIAHLEERVPRADA